ncbi:MAG: hypothetical protein KDB14_18710 [Planctomycetales bacterium]|nr:hypothetical protein [Planctomycetales bacterium]
MAQLHFDGYYEMGPVAWEDWHAGVRMHGVRFHYTRYYPDGVWLSCYRDREFPFWEFTESVTPELLAAAKVDRAPRIGEGDPLCTAGAYVIEDDWLNKVFEPAWTGGMTWESKYRIVDDRLLVPNPDGPDGAWLFRPARQI